MLSLNTIRRNTSRRLFLLLAVLAVLALISADRGPTAAADPPIINEQIVATYVGDSLTLTGTSLGDNSSTSRSIKFTYGPNSTTVDDDDPLVSVWNDNEITLSIPPGVQSGQLVVTVDGKSSAPVDLSVFGYVGIDIPPEADPGTGDIPLAVALAPDGTLWFNSEFHKALQAVSGDPAHELFSAEVDQVAGPGIFALFSPLNCPDGCRRRFSFAGEDIAIASDGGVWFTQGGDPYYPQGLMPFNTSRVVRYDPATEALHRKARVHQRNHIRQHALQLLLRSLC